MIIILKIVLEDKKISILLNTITLETWNDTISNVIHLPNLKAKVFYEGKFYDGIGYSKRYSWKHTPRYWDIDLFRDLIKMIKYLDS